MKERGIIFSDWEVRAILAGRKTMFRRAIKPQPSKEALGAEPALPGSDVWQFFNRPNRQGKHNGGMLVSTVKCPFGTVGDRLYVKETFMVQPSKGCTFGEVMRGSKLSVQYKDGKTVDVDNGWHATGPNMHMHGVNYEYSHEYYGRWRSPATMPRWASRLKLEIVNVRVERVQDITEQDAIAEGMRAFSKEWKRPNPVIKYWPVDPIEEQHPKSLDCDWSDMPRSAIVAFASSFNSIHGLDAWDRNDWVRAVTFRKIQGVAA